MTLDAGRVIVPDLVGALLTLERFDGFRLASGHELQLVSSDPDGPPVGVMIQEGGWLVLAQRPAAGTIVERGSTVWVTAMRGGGGGEAGDREPRDPSPPAGALTVQLDEPRKVRADR
jgi:hypothetical protein